jgi:hypothetical protein
LKLLFCLAPLSRIFHQGIDVNLNSSRGWSMCRWMDEFGFDGADHVSLLNKNARRAMRHNDRICCQQRKRSELHASPAIQSAIVSASLQHVALLRGGQLRSDFRYPVGHHALGKGCCCCCCLSTHGREGSGCRYRGKRRMQR